MRRAVVADICDMSSLVREVPLPSGTEESRPGLSLERAVGSVLALVAVLLVWREVEPLVLFRPVDGVVLSSGIVESETYGRRGRKHPYIAERVYYRYELGGERFVSFQYRRTNLLGLRSQAVEVTNRYARHDRVRVWYNPLNHADAVISRKPDWFLFAAIALFWAVWVRAHHVTRSRRQLDAAAQRISGRSHVA